MDISGNSSLFQYYLSNNLNTNYSALSQLNPNSPEQSRLYFEQKFSDIFSSFLTESSSTGSDVLGSGSSSDSDIFGSSDPFAANTNYELAKMGMLQNNFSSSGNLDLLNNAAALIGKEVAFVNNNITGKGIIESVVNENGTIMFKVDGELIPMSGIREITKGET